jgi:DHA2 family multidrug resistance protein-like MFS transporter
MVEREGSRIYRLRWWTLLVLTLTSMIMGMNTFIMTVALPTIQSEIGATGTQLQWIVNIYMMVAGAFMLTCGALSDRMGRAKLFQAGLVVFCLANVGCLFATTATHLIIARAFMAVGMAMLTPPILAIITNVFPKEEQAKAISAWAGIGAIALSLGPIIGGAIVENLDWKWIFWFNIIVIVVAFVLGWFLVPDSRDDRPRRLDLLGNALFLAGIASLIYGLNNAGSDGWSDPIVLCTIIISMVILTLFVLWERRTAQPLLNLGFFRSAGFSTSVTTMVIFMLGYGAILYLLTFYMQFAKGYTPIETGIRYLPLGIGLLVGSIASARLATRLGWKRVTSLGCLGVAIMLLCVAFVKIDTPFSQLGAELFFLGFFMGCIYAPASTMLMGSLPRAEAGISSGMSNVANQVGGSIGVAIAGSILSTIYSDHFVKAVESIQGLPAALVDKASDSIGIALRVVASGQIPSESVGSFVQAARESFMDGWQIDAIILCAIFAAGAVICLRFMPHRVDESKDTTIEEAGSKDGSESD